MFTEQIINIVYPFIIAFGIVFALHPFLVKIALQKNIVDVPNARRLNIIPIPVLGGLGVFTGFIMAFCICAAMRNIYVSLIYIAVILLMMGVGMLDDILEFKPRSKFFAQILSVVALMLYGGLIIDNLHGVFGIYELPYLISIPITIVACVGLINAVNLIDGVDGLSSGFGIIAGTLFCVWGIGIQDNLGVLISSSITGALIPFFIYNVYGRRFKMFIGDGGSQLLGMICSLVMLRYIKFTPVESNVGPCVIAFLWALFAHPIIDTLRVMITRICKGKSPFSPDKNHFHHIIVSMGFSHPVTTFIILSFNLVIVLIWWISYLNGASATEQFIVSFAASLTFILLPYLLIQYFRENNSKSFNRLKTRIELARIGRRHQIVVYSFLNRVTRSFRN